MSVTKWRWALLALSLVLMALAVGACGDDDDDDSGGGGTTAAETTAAAEPATCTDEKVKFQLSFFPNAQHAGYLLADSEGLFEEEGLNVTVKEGGPTVNPALQVAQGNVDIGQMEFAEILNANANGANMKWVAQTYQQNPLRYVSLKEEGITSPEKLKGKSVGSQQTGDLNPELLGILQGAGLTGDDVTIKPIGFSTEDLVKKKIDSFPLYLFFHVSQLDEGGMAYPDDLDVLDPNQLGATVASQGVAVNGDFYEKSPEAVECFLRASLRGWQMAIDDPAGVVDAVMKAQPPGIASKKATTTNLEQTIELVTMNAAGDTVDPLTIDQQYLEDSATFLREVGTVKNEDITVESVLDTAPLEAAQAAVAEGN